MMTLLLSHLATLVVALFALFATLRLDTREALSTAAFAVFRVSVIHCMALLSGVLSACGTIIRQPHG
jgi:hypothetical protein